MSAREIQVDWRARIRGSRQGDGSYRWGWTVPTGSGNSTYPTGAICGGAATQQEALRVVGDLLSGRRAR